LNEHTINLNPEQRAAAEFLWKSHTRALQLIAGAGSGKTSTLIAAAMSAVKNGIAADKIAVITFSRRAANELKERFSKAEISLGYCGTMHALAWKILRRRGDKRQIQRHSEHVRGELARQLFSEFAHIPTHILTSRGFLSNEKVATLEEHYAAFLNEHQRLDFDTMIREAIPIADTTRFDTVLVDEFQDTSPDQVEFIKSLKPQKLFVVGDDWQSIYRFRGADVTITQNFADHFSESERLFLRKNYRSDKAIVRLGNRAIKLSKHYVRKKLSATHPKKLKPMLYFTPKSEKVEDVWHQFIAKYPAQKTTVLVRTNAIRELLEKNKPDYCDILTIHKSKGLEFDNVVVFGVAEHLIPHRENDYDEEVRIFYVALTRAKKSISFVAWQSGDKHSAFLPFLMRHSKLVYI